MPAPTFTLPGYNFTQILSEDPKTGIYRGTREDDGVAVIVKTLRAAYPALEDVARLRHEYEVMRDLPVAGVLQPLDLVRNEHGLALLLEDFGALSLREFLAKQSGGLELELFFAFALELAGTLEQMHARHIVHRDIKPGNILVNAQTRQIKISDFGIASRLLQESATDGGISMRGTLSYMSPEQTGRMNSPVDYRTDFYSLGVTLFEMLTGRLPFEATDPLELVHCHIARTPPAPHEINAKVPTSLSAIVLKLLSKTAHERYRSARGLAADLTECARRLQNGESEKFPLGTQDHSSELQISHKIYGREREVNALLEAFERAANAAGEMVMVSGFSGIGKTSVVHEVHKPIVARRGYFVSGKFDQFRRNVPYDSLLQAFQELIRQILTESEERLEHFRAQLKEALGANAQVIIEVIPEVELILGAQPEAPTLGPQEAQNRLNLAFQNFIGVFAAKAHPLVLFLDDLQWADPASLRLLQTLMADAARHQLLIIGAYRDNEVSPSHPLVLALEEIRKSGANVSEISIGPLQLSCAEQLVEDSLHCANATSAPLAALLHQRTEGNPFFLNQLLRFLYDEKLLHFDNTKGEWQWDLTEIQNAGLTADVVELMAGKIQKLPEAAREALKIAACVGGTFDSRTLALARECSEQVVGADLWEAVREGLIRPLDDEHQMLRAMDESSPNVGAAYRFLHDRVQQAALSMVPDDEQRRLHLHLGRMLLRNSQTKRDEQIFEIANHFDEALELISEPEERATVSQVNFEAGRKARGSSAYNAALRYFTVASDFAPPTLWQDNYETAFLLTQDYAECEYLAGNFAGAEKLFAVLQHNARSALERAAVDRLLAQLYITAGKLDEAINTGLAALRQLNVPMDFAPSQSAVMRELVRVKLGQRRRSIEDLYNAPLLTDQEKEVALSVLSIISPAAYLSGYQNLFSLIILNMVNLTMRYGNSSYAAHAYALYGVLLGGGLGAFKSGDDFGLLALRLVEKFREAKVRSYVFFTYPTFIRHWRHPLKGNDEYFLQSYHAGLESGELIFSGYAVFNLSTHSFLCGAPLESVDERVQQYLGFLRWTKDSGQLIMAQITRQSARNFQGFTRKDERDATLLDEEDFDESENLAVLKQRGNGSGLCWYYIAKLRLAFFWGDFEIALRMAHEAENIIAGLFSTPYVVEHNFFSSLTLAALYNQANKSDQKTYGKRLRKNQKQLKKWAANSPQNNEHKYLLVAAEMARLKGQNVEAAAFYDSSIRAAQEAEFTQNEALTNELAARFYDGSNRASLARGYREQARYLYEKWGADAKVAALEKEFPELVPVVPERSIAQRTVVDVQRTTNPMGAEKSSVLDLATVIKAAQAISGEIDLANLLSHLLRFAMENAGATRGLLLLENNGQWRIAASGSLEQDAVVLEAQPGPAASTASGEEAPLSLIQYVARTRRHIVLQDAGSDELFGGDAYIAARHPKAVLCAPIIHQGRLTGLIYLENNLAVGAFTPAHLEVLNVLSSQAAISLQNAELYGELEERVEERTEQLSAKNSELETALRELKEMQNRIIEQQKMASLGVLTAGIAHEIKNPLNFVNNFAVLSLGLVNELNAEIEKVKEHFSADDLDYLEEIMGDLQGNMTRINEHGKRADSIVRSMLMHSRGQTEQPESVNLNNVVHEAVQLAYHGQRALNANFNVTIKEDYAPDLPLVRVLPQEISRVILNIAGNACYAVHQKSARQSAEFTPTLRVWTKLSAHNVEIHIADNGEGIPTEVREKIFNPFFTTKPTGEGTGLGLSMSYDIIVQQHNGEIRVESTPGEGSEFIVTLPKTGIKTN